MKKWFRIISFAEAISFLLLLGVAMPLKYFNNMPEAIKYPGWIHGLLFILYVVLLVALASDEKWSLKKIFWGLIASLLPFGPFVFHRKFMGKAN